MSTNPTVAACNWVLAKTGTPQWEEIRAQIWDRNDAWQYALANDRLVWKHEIKREGIADADRLLENNAGAGFRAFLNLAEEGSVWAMCMTAFLYEHGNGAAADAGRAEYWYRRSSEAGCTRAVLNLRTLLARRGDRDGAEGAFPRSLAEEWAPASFWFAWYRIKRSHARRTLIEVRPFLERAAAQGSPAARWSLAGHMAIGRFGASEIPRGLKALWEFSGWVMPEADVAQSGSEPGPPVGRSPG